MDVVCAVGVSAVAEGLTVAVDVITRMVGGGVNVGIGSGVGRGLQAERINKTNPMYWNLFIHVFLWKYRGVNYIPTGKVLIKRPPSSSRIRRSCFLLFTRYFLLVTSYLFALSHNAFAINS
jgi:hypothetical protein